MQILPTFWILLWQKSFCLYWLTQMYLWTTCSISSRQKNWQMKLTPSVLILCLNFSVLLMERIFSHRFGHFSCASTLPAGLLVVNWFLLSVLGYKASFQLVFSWLFRMIFLQFSCNSSLEEVCAASTYSSAILDLSSWPFLLDFVLVLRGLTRHFQMTLTMHGPLSPTLSIIL